MSVLSFAFLLTDLSASAQRASARFQPRHERVAGELATLRGHGTVTRELNRSGQSSPAQRAAMRAHRAGSPGSARYQPSPERISGELDALRGAGLVSRPRSP